MKFGKYLKDRLYSVIIYIFVIIAVILLMPAFKSQIELKITVGIIITLLWISEIFIDFFRKKRYFDEFVNNTQNLEQKYLVMEMLSEPSFYEGKIIYDVISDIDKSMVENVKKYCHATQDFKEYVEMWIHEIKLPIASMTLILHNYKEKYPDVTERMTHHVNRVNNYLEQILYYVRSENAQKDYIISDCRLSKLIAAVAVKNTDDILENNIDFQVENADADVCTDSKWLEFILNQIISNSIKYRDEKKTDGSVIKIYVIKNDKLTVLNIYDNGIGIPAADLPRVFDKSFTGENGHAYSKATGMGMYIVKNLCEKLGHKITIESVKGEYTLVSIEFFKNDFYKETLLLRNIM